MISVQNNLAVKALKACCHWVVKTVSTMNAENSKHPSIMKSYPQKAGIRIFSGIYLKLMDFDFAEMMIRGFYQQDPHKQ
jgi:hypothetical protein